MLSKPSIIIRSRYLGFGTCCTIVLEAGGTSSLNQSYMVQASTTSLATGSMTYMICPCSNDVCRIRFDFTVSIRDELGGTMASYIYIYIFVCICICVKSFYSNLC